MTVGTVYLLHFDRPYRHAGHYTGSAASSGLLKVAGHISDGLAAALVERVGKCRLDIAHPGTGEEPQRRNAGARSTRRQAACPAGRHVPAQVQQSRTLNQIPLFYAGLLTQIQESPSTPSQPVACHLSCDTGACGRLPTQTNSRQLQHWSKDLPARLAEHAAGGGARLTAVVRAAGIGWQLARTWTADRGFERRLKNRHGASRYCPICQQSQPPQRGGGSS